MRRRRALLAATLGGLALIGLLFAFVYPMRTYLSQRHQIGAAQQHVHQLEAASAALRRQSSQLAGDAAVVRIAREQYGLVRPGETPYVLVPAATTPTSAPTPTTTAPVAQR